MGKITLKKMKVLIFLALIATVYSQRMATPEEVALYNLKHSQDKVQDAETCLGDLMRVIPEIQKAITDRDMASIIAAPTDAANALKDCAGQFVDFSDECKNDFKHMHDVSISVDDHLAKIDIAGLEEDFKDAEATIQRMMSECKPQPKNQATVAKFLLMKQKIAQEVMDN